MLECKSENNKKEKYYPLNPQYTPYSTSHFDDDTFTPALTNTLVPSQKRKQMKNRKRKKTLKTNKKLTPKQNTIWMIQWTSCNLNNINYPSGKLVKIGNHAYVVYDNLYIHFSCIVYRLG